MSKIEIVKKPEDLIRLGEGTSQQTAMGTLGYKR